MDVLSLSQDSMTRNTKIVNTRIVVVDFVQMERAGMVIALSSLWPIPFLVM